ncbi:hypothetical protein AVEN_148445-1 [Araneus ventricosus]|uniref:Helitron helicase-like domain-containing protein n=1 Tax=Araneus ventricosus TaxID=182803 RepID=A0A4Y2R516_ARAVE|nr:hypothetical protein AVEN_148445-1 [Araneus ventricosus]
MATFSFVSDTLHVHRVADFISAEIFNPQEDPDLFFCIVTKQTVHGPFGSIDPRSRSMKDGICTKRYPCHFLEQTQIGQEGYPLYRWMGIYCKQQFSRIRSVCGQYLDCTILPFVNKNFKCASQQHKHFLTNIRLYNYCFQKTFSGTTKEIIEYGYTSAFNVQGQVHHRIGSLYPLPNKEPKFLQIYFVGDGTQQAEKRCKNVLQTRQDVVLQLKDILDRHLLRPELQNGYE